MKAPHGLNTDRTSERDGFAKKLKHTSTEIEDIREIVEDKLAEVSQVIA